MNKIKISDPEKGLIEYNLANSLRVKDFNKILSSKAGGFRLAKVADIHHAPHLAAGYAYVNKSNLWSRANEGFVYVVAVDKKIVKIGMTEKSLNSRFSSYRAGTKTAREKGTCSVTNYYCSEFFREALSASCDVEIFAYHVPTRYIKANILGVQKSLIAKQAYAYEDALLEIYQQKKGEVPVLCKNTSLI